MGNPVARLLGSTFLVSLALLVPIVLLAAATDLPSRLGPEALTIWGRVGATILALSVALLCALCSSLTLRTRYAFAGVAGLMSAAIALGIAVLTVWGSAGSTLVSTRGAFDPGQLAPGGVPSSMMGGILAVVAVAVALPIVNLVLAAAYGSTVLAEALGIVTAVVLVGWCANLGLAIGSGGPSPSEQGLYIAGAAVGLAGVIATPVAALLGALRPSPAVPADDDFTVLSETPFAESYIGRVQPPEFIPARAVETAQRSEVALPPLRWE